MSPWKKLNKKKTGRDNIKIESKAREFNAQIFQEIGTWTSQTCERTFCCGIIGAGIPSNPGGLLQNSANVWTVRERFSRERHQHRPACDRQMAKRVNPDDRFATSYSHGWADISNRDRKTDRTHGCRSINVSPHIRCEWGFRVARVAPDNALACIAVALSLHPSDILPP